MKTWKLVSGIISIVWGIGLFIVAIKNGVVFLPIMEGYLDVFGNLGGFIAVCLFAGAGTLSGGQKQRVIILSALLSDKEILFFDEPTSGLDYRNMMIVAKNIKKVKEENRLILIISHDTEFLESVCDTVINL